MEQTRGRLLFKTEKLDKIIKFSTDNWSLMKLPEVRDGKSEGNRPPRGHRSRCDNIKADLKEIGSARGSLIG